MQLTPEQVERRTHNFLNLYKKKNKNPTTVSPRNSKNEESVGYEIFPKQQKIQQKIQQQKKQQKIQQQQKKQQKTQVQCIQGWKEHYDTQVDTPYYYHQQSGIAEWKCPTTKQEHQKILQKIKKLSK